MGIVIYIFLSLFVSVGRAEVTDVDERLMIERSKERCEDFKRRAAAEEETNRNREKYAQEIKKTREQDRQRTEAARIEYVKSRKKEVVDPNLEKAWLEQDKAWIEQNRAEAKRYAQKRAAAEAIEKRGCHIPENEEFGLEE